MRTLCDSSCGGAAPAASLSAWKASLCLAYLFRAASTSGTTTSNISWRSAVGAASASPSPCATTKLLRLSHRRSSFVPPRSWYSLTVFAALYFSYRTPDGLSFAFGFSWRHTIFLSSLHGASLGQRFFLLGCFGRSGSGGLRRLGLLAPTLMVLFLPSCFDSSSASGSSRRFTSSSPAGAVSRLASCSASLGCRSRWRSISSSPSSRSSWSALLNHSSSSSMAPVRAGSLSALTTAMSSFSLQFLTARTRGAPPPRGAVSITRCPADLKPGPQSGPRYRHRPDPAGATAPIFPSSLSCDFCSKNASAPNTCHPSTLVARPVHLVMGDRRSGSTFLPTPRRLMVMTAYFTANSQYSGPSPASSRIALAISITCRIALSMCGV